MLKNSCYLVNLIFLVCSLPITNNQPSPVQEKSIESNNESNNNEILIFI